MASREKRTLTLDPEVDGLLSRVGNASEYVSRAVAMRWREWTQAHATLVAAGWRGPELLAACDVLNGYWMVGEGRSPGFVALELADGERLNKVCEKWDVPPERWQARINELSERADIAHALCTIVEEFWLGNEACEEVLRRPDPVGDRYEDIREPLTRRSLDEIESDLAKTRRNP